MKTPKMIVFDYGHTLLHEPDIDFVRGERALFEYIRTNPDHLSPEQVSAYADELYEQFASVRSLGIEIHQYQFQRLLFERLGITFSLEAAEIEQILWTAAAPGAMMPDADTIIDYINQNGIRSGVISNISWSGNALQRRMDRLLPRNQFEFVIASSEYGVRKPNQHLFQLALRKAGLPPEEAWYCGDNPRADVEGASQVGILPVWYDHYGKRETMYRPKQAVPACEYVYIREWRELIQLLETGAQKA